jgi:hypothetical protein
LTTSTRILAALRNELTIIIADPKTEPVIKVLLVEIALETSRNYEQKLRERELTT